MSPPSTARGRIAAALAACASAAALLACSGCAPAAAPVERAVEDYVRLVQLEDSQALYCLSAGARPAEGREGTEGERRGSFEGWLGGEYDHYLEGRLTGSVDLEASPVALAKAFALGKGTFYSLGPVRFVGEGEARVDMTVRFAYADVNVAGLSPGTTFYLCGVPPGRIHAVRVPRTPGTETRVVLDTVLVRWTLLKESAAGGCPEGWAVHAAEPVPGTETTRAITWVF